MKPPVIERLSSGIQGLDKLIEGGFIKNNVYLVTGSAGTGKTLFCCQFLWEGLQNGEKCIFFSLEEQPQSIIHDAAGFGWDMQKYIDKKMLMVEYNDPFEMVDITTLVKEKIEKFGATRVVIDSTSIFGMVFENEHELRRRLYELIKALKQTGAATLLTAEVPEGSNALSRFHVEEFVVDGVVILYYSGDDSSLEIRKMRRTSHARGCYTLEFTKNGLAVKGKTELTSN